MHAIKFFVDECVGPRLAQWLEQEGFDVISVYDEMPGITDTEVLARALLENRILITSDKDFGDMVFRERKQHCGIVLLRLADQASHNKIQFMQQVLSHYRYELQDNFTVVTEKSIRLIRMKPVGIS